MAVMLDDCPGYNGEDEVVWQGEKRVWECIKDNFPDDHYCCRCRSVNGYEFDYCLIMKGMGILVIEVKGWNPAHIAEVRGSCVITSEGKKASPKNQAHNYALQLVNVLWTGFRVNPLILSAVCYPFLSRAQYIELGLDAASEPQFTFFKEDIESPELFTVKAENIFYNDHRFRSIRSCSGKYDLMDGDVLDACLEHFRAPQAEKRGYAPRYSRLSVFPDGLSPEASDDIIRAYFKGEKQVIFTGKAADLDSLARRLRDIFGQRHIHVSGGKLSVSRPDMGASDIAVKDGKLLLFCFEAYYVPADKLPAAFTAFSGELTDGQRDMLVSIAGAADFNINQYNIEHADIGRDIMVMAGAGTGKTYSMVSRISYLCSSDSGADITSPSDEIAMLTFTVDAAVNMKTRIKQQFINYFLLTGSTKYLDMTADAEKMRISTIHKFAREIIGVTAINGVGTDFKTVRGGYYKQRFFDKKFDEFLSRLTGGDPLFFEDSPLGIYDLRKLMRDFANKVYEKGVDIKKVTDGCFGAPPADIPYLNELIREAVIAAEYEYSEYLARNNSVSGEEYMIYLMNCINDDSFNAKLFRYKYMFIDEFQDTDNAQIAAFLEMQRKLGFSLFIVGDMKQSIYRFRGATMSAFDKMGCGSDKWLSFTLNINYRSDRRLLDKYSGIFSYMGRKRLLPYEPVRDMLTGVKENPDISGDALFTTVYDDRDGDYYQKLFDLIISQKERILSEIGSGKELSDAERTIAVLTRSNSEIAKICMLASKNRQFGEIIESEKNNNLYRTEPCIDLCRLTAAMCSPYDPAYLYDLITSAYVGCNFDVRTLIGKSMSIKTDILVECLDSFFGMTMGMSWEELIHAVQSEPVLKNLRLIYQAVKPWRTYSARMKHSDYYMDEYKVNYEMVFEMLSDMSRDRYLTIGSINDLLHSRILTGAVAESRQAERDDESGGKVRIICTNVHKSKGLEYGTVILPCDCSDRDTGLDISFEDGKLGYCITAGREQYASSNFAVMHEQTESINEESRILYVAMTRAINNFIWFSGNNSEGNLWRKILGEQGHGN